ncbi:MAG: amidase [Deltaproteobacteria bacterium]|jgi:Asp-tRNA(Asn)/Glu-tRNA(Gln) amidotransferase A subunit family amidase|nr:amidase [Deltaproteobacteria bacterium]
MKDAELLGQPPLIAELAGLDGAGLAQAYTRLLERIALLDPVLRVFEGGAPDMKQVLEECALLADRWPHPSRRPPLFGLPVGVKSVMRVAGRQIRCGSLLPADLFAGEEAALVSQLREAGAIILGHTASAEFAYFEPAPTCNPHHCGHTPGGSSSGSAAGVAAGFFSIGVGTQTVGSVIRPASYCGVTGFKPSYERLPLDGVIPFSRSMDHPGFFGVGPREIAAVMAALDAQWRQAALPRALRLALPTGPYLHCALPQSASWLRIRTEAVAARLEKQGCFLELVELPCLENIHELCKRHEVLIAAEAAQTHQEWFARFAPLYRPRTAELIQRGRRAAPEDVEEARASRLELRRRLHELMEEHKVDFWISPSSVGEADAALYGTGSPIMNLPWTHAGLPTLSLPLGRGAQGLPLGMQLVGGFGQDEEVLAAGAAMWTT